MLIWTIARKVGNNLEAVKILLHFWNVLWLQTTELRLWTHFNQNIFEIKILEIKNFRVRIDTRTVVTDKNNLR